MATSAPRRVMEASFSPEAIRAEWQPLAWGEPMAMPETARAYTRFYGLDLVEQGDARRQDLGWFDAAGERIATQVFYPAVERGTTVLCHGYLDHAGLYTHLIRDLLALGQVVVIYDLPGHGLSTGDEVAIDSFLDYVAVLRTCFTHMHDHFPGPWHLVAQSTGGAVAMDWMLYPRRDDPRLASVTLLAPLVRPVGWRWGRLVHPLIRPFRDYVKRVFIGNSHDPDFVDFLEYRDPLQSRWISIRWVEALRQWLHRFRAAPPSSYSPRILQGDADGTVDWQHNLPAIRARFRAPSVHMIPGANHHLANEVPRYRAVVRYWLEQTLA
jgi:alpha-beta hydrolase superfamily lysophospholipase